MSNTAAERAKTGGHGVWTRAWTSATKRALGRLLVWTCTVGVLGLSFGLPALAQGEGGAETGSGTVEGVLDMGGMPQAGLEVVASSSTSSSFESVETSDSEGRFSFEQVPLGTVYVKCFSADQELIAEGEVQLTEDGATVTVDVRPVS